MGIARTFRFAKRRTSGKKYDRGLRFVSQWFVSQIFNRRGLRQATIDETGVGFDLSNKE